MLNGVISMARKIVFLHPAIVLAVGQAAVVGEALVASSYRNGMTSQSDYPVRSSGLQERVRQFALHVVVGAGGYSWDV